MNTFCFGTKTLSENINQYMQDG